nr:MAG: nonstructural protein 1 [Protoparvovirus sp.]
MYQGNTDEYSRGLSTIPQMQAQVECTRPLRYLLWLGVTGTSRDISAQQAETILINKDYVASPMPLVESQCRNINMKTFQCCILQLSNYDGTPIDEPIAYALLLNELTCVDNWIITGETNDDKIFHCHCLLKTNSRSDSSRRSIYTAHTNIRNNDTMLYYCNGDSTLDVLKIQKCHKPDSLLAYALKNPQWVMSNHDKYLQLSYDIEQHELNARFKQEKSTEIGTPEMSPIAQEIISIIIQHSCKSIEDIFRNAPDIMCKYLQKPGLNTIVQNCLSFVKATKGSWSLKNFEHFEPDPETIHKYLLHQGIQPSDFDQKFHSWITKKSGKKNTILLYGPSNTGKTSFITGLKANVPWGECINGTTFNFEALVDQYMAVWEEPLIGPETAEKFKQIAEGIPTSIPIKYRKPYLLDRTPLMMTSNHHPWRFCTSEQDAMQNRMFIFNCNHAVQDSYYYPRASEQSCKCRYCTASRGGAHDDGVASLANVQRAKQPLSTGEQSIRTDPINTMGSGSVLDPGEGTSSSNNSTRGSTSNSTDISSTNTTITTCSSSSTIEQYFRPGGRTESSSSSDRIYNTGSVTEQHVESKINRGCDDSDSSRDGTTDRDNRRGRTGKVTQKRHNTVQLDTSKRGTQKKTVQIRAKQPKLDRSMGAKVGANKLIMFIPSKEDWQTYLSYLHHIYG